MYTPTKPKRTWRTWAAWFVGFLVLTTAGRMYGEFAGKRDANADLNARPAAPNVQTPQAKVTATITRQDSEGITVAQMDQAFADRLGSFIAARLSEEMGEPFTSGASYVGIGGKRLALVRLSTQGLSPVAQLASIDGGEMVRVTCMADALSDVHIETSPCADKVREAFGVDPAAGIVPWDSVQASLSSPPKMEHNAQAQSSAFDVRALGGGVSIAVPKDWRWMDNADASSLNTSSEALADSLGVDAKQGNNTVLIAGNAFNDARQSVATMRVSVRSSAEMGQAEMREGMKEPKASTDAALMQAAEITAAAMRKVTGMSYYRVVAASLDQNPTLICIKTTYEYDQGQGPMVSDAWVCPLGSRTVKLTTSYQKARANLFVPTINYIWRSLTVSG